MRSFREHLQVGIFKEMMLEMNDVGRRCFRWNLEDAPKKNSEARVDEIGKKSRRFDDKRSAFNPRFDGDDHRYEAKGQCI